jgi:surface polysaccharide O-acyltransferase-like enzyme
MISGTIFLEKYISFSVIVKKYIKNLFIHFLFWSFFYSFRQKILKNITIKQFYLLFFKGYFHLWYLFSICGFYFITPFLKEITKNEKFELFLTLNFIFAFLFPNLITFFKFSSKEYYNTINKILQNIRLGKYLDDKIFYYMFGFYLNKKNIRDLLRKIIYILGFCGIIFTSTLTFYISSLKNIKITFYSASNINEFFMNIAIFIFFKYNFNDLKNKKRVKEFIQKLSRLTFGIYLIHPFVIEELYIRFKLNTLSFDPLYSIPINSLITFLISLLIVYFLKFLPLINQYIV